jgi:hypothetical protein
LHALPLLSGLFFLLCHAQHRKPCFGLCFTVITVGAIVDLEFAYIAVGMGMLLVW